MRYTPPSSSIDPIDRLRAQTQARIDHYGFTKLIIGSGECAYPGCQCEPEPHSYTYSLGMCNYLSPEFVTFGLPMSHVASVVDPVCKAVIAGRRLPIGEEHRCELPEGGPTVTLVEVPDVWVDHDPGRVGSWFDLFEPRWPSFVQIFWSDEFGAMPWEPDCNPAVTAMQPILADDPISTP